MKLAEAYGWEGRARRAPGEVAAAIERMLAAAEAPTCWTWPFLPIRTSSHGGAGGGLDDVMGRSTWPWRRAHRYARPPGSLRPGGRGWRGGRLFYAKLDAQFAAAGDRPEDTAPVWVRRLHRDVRPELEPCS